MRRVFERDGAPLQRGAQLSRGHRCGVGTEYSFVGFELHPTEQARVADDELSVTGKSHHQTVPGPLGPVARVDEALNTGGAIDEQAPRHAEMKAEPPTGPGAGTEL